MLAIAVSVGLFADSEIEWTRHVRTTIGLRGDVYDWNVASNNPLNSGQETSAIASPKLSAAFGPDVTEPIKALSPYLI